MPLGRERRVEAPAPFRALGLIGGARGLRVRASVDGVTWTVWLEPGDDGLVYFGELYRYFEFQSTPQSNAEVLFIDPGVTPAAPAARPLPGAPPMVTREQWGCTPQTCPQAAPPVYTTPTHLIVHHSAGANTATDWAAVVRSIWVLHVQGNGWNDIGYNYLIDPNGVFYEGRAGGDGVLGAHFSSVNGGTVGICLLGTFSTQPAPDSALQTLTAALAWQAQKWTIDPLAKRTHTASALLIDTISGHRDANLSPAASGTTECPGNGLYAVLPELRSRVYQALAGDCPVTVSSRHACAPASGGQLTFSASGCELGVRGTPSWLTVSPSGITVEANPGVRRTGSFSIGGRIVSVTQSAAGEPDLPCIGWGGLVSAALDSARPVVAGSLISIFGSNLAGGTVTIDGMPATTFYAGPDQINAQVPPDTNIGSARAVVTVNGVSSPEVIFPVTEAVPAVFTLAGRAVAQNYDDGALNGPTAPARSGSYVTIYLTGAGALNRTFPPSGSATPLTPLYAVKAPWSATIGGLPAAGLFLGLTPNSIGLYQANLAVPATLAPGDYPVVITVAGVPSVPAILSVGH